MEEETPEGERLQNGIRIKTKHSREYSREGILGAGALYSGRMGAKKAHNTVRC